MKTELDTFSFNQDLTVIEWENSVFRTDLEK